MLLTYPWIFKVAAVLLWWSDMVQIYTAYSI